METVVNLTGHPLTLSDGRRFITIPSTGRARVISRKETIRFIEVDGIRIPVVGMTRKEIVGLPGPSPGVTYAVSGIVADVADRDDVVSPGGLVRENDKGRVKGCKNFVRVLGNEI